MLTQLQTPLPLRTPEGKAWAVAIIDYGPHWDLLWVTFIHATANAAWLPVWTIISLSPSTRTILKTDSSSNWTCATYRLFI